MWASYLHVSSSNRTARNNLSEKYVITCEDRITQDDPTTNEWLSVVGSLKKTNQRDLNRVLQGVLDKKHQVAIKISNSQTLHKEYTIASILNDIPGFIRPICFFQCNDDFKEHPSKTHTILCKGPGSSMSVLLLPYLTEGSMRSFDWSTKVGVLQSCILQLFCSLMQAYEMKGILHNDTHLDNVMLKKTTVAEVEYTLGGKKFAIPTNGYFIAIMDFELSFNEIASNRGRAIGQLYDDLLHSISDLRYESTVSVFNDEPLMSALMHLKSNPAPVYEAISILTPLIKKITIAPKIVHSFVYDPYTFG
jgi:hypothetical protein